MSSTSTESMSATASGVTAAESPARRTLRAFDALASALADETAAAMRAGQSPDRLSAFHAAVMQLRARHERDEPAHGRKPRAAAEGR